MFRYSRIVARTTSKMLLLMALFAIAVLGQITFAAQFPLSLETFNITCPAPPLGVALISYTHAIKLNVSADQPLMFGPGKYVISEITISNCNQDTQYSNATGGIYTQPHKKGVALVAPDQSYDYLTQPLSSYALPLTIKPRPLVSRELYFSLTRRSYMPITCDIYVYGYSTS
jgi:hypothetical protein